MFWAVRRARKHTRGTNASQLVLLSVGLLLLVGCLPDPQRIQMAQLFDQLVEARGGLAQQPPRLDTACDSVGYVGSRLSGEPGLVDVRPAWAALRAATDALLGVCGQQRLLEQPFEPTAAMLVARQRWQAGATSDLESACRHLRVAASAVARPVPC